MKVDNNFLPEMVQTVYFVVKVCCFCALSVPFIAFSVFTDNQNVDISACIQKVLSLATREVCGISNQTLPL